MPPSAADKVFFPGPGNFLKPFKMPADRLAVPIRHPAVKNGWIVIKNQRQKVAVAWPHGQGVQQFDRLPAERAFRVVGKRCSAEAVDAEDKSQPVLAVFTEACPVDGAPQGQGDAFYPCLLPDFPSHAAGHIFISPHFAAKSVVFAEMRIVFPGIAMDQQGLLAVRGKDKAQGGDDGGVSFAHFFVVFCRGFRFRFVRKDGPCLAFVCAWCKGAQKKDKKSLHPCVMTIFCGRINNAAMKLPAPAADRIWSGFF